MRDDVPVAQSPSEVFIGFCGRFRWMLILIAILGEAGEGREKPWMPRNKYAIFKGKFCV